MTGRASFPASSSPMRFYHRSSLAARIALAKTREMEDEEGLLLRAQPTRER